MTTFRKRWVNLGMIRWSFVYHDSTQLFFVMLRLPQIQNLEHIEDSKVFGPEIDNHKLQLLFEPEYKFDARDSVYPFFEVVLEVGGKTFKAQVHSFHIFSHHWHYTVKTMLSEQLISKTWKIIPGLYCFVLQA
jgi:hypothetical protein